MCDNDQIAGLLDDIADLLENREADAHRVRAYRDAGRSVRGSQASLPDLYSRKGEEGLREIPGIGQGLSSVIAEYLRTGHSSLHDDLVARADPVHLFRQLPGISEKLARRITKQLEVRSLEELELAAHDGRLKKLKGFGPERVRAVKEVLAGRLSPGTRGGREQSGEGQGNRGEPSRPPVSLLIDLDREYRDKARAGELEMIAPRRFNPEGKAWLPLMKTKRKGWSFTVLYSNTSRAHQLGKTHDWVVVYYHRDGSEGQCTLVTASQGDLAGDRVVRGREQECRRHYGLA